MQKKQIFRESGLVTSGTHETFFLKEATSQPVQCILCVGKTLSHQE